MDRSGRTPGTHGLSQHRSGSDLVDPESRLQQIETCKRGIQGQTNGVSQAHVAQVRSGRPVFGQGFSLAPR